MYHVKHKQYAKALYNAFIENLYRIILQKSIKIF